MVLVPCAKVQDFTFEIETENIDKPCGGCTGVRQWFWKSLKKMAMLPSTPACQLPPSAGWLLYHLFSSSGCAFGTFVAPVLADRMGVLVRMVPGHAWTMAKKIGKWEQVRKKVEDV